MTEVSIFCVISLSIIYYNYKSFTRFNKDYYDTNPCVYNTLFFTNSIVMTTIMFSFYYITIYVWNLF